MSRFAPYTSDSALPDLGALETNTLDFKGKLNLREGKADLAELAKDAAAFANADGGVLLVGAYEADKRGVLAHYKPVGDEAVKEMREAYSNAIARLCSPVPVHTSVKIPKDAGFVVAVNVWPFPGQAIGVRETADGQKFSFPLRSGIECTYLRPEQLPMLMIPALRRVITSLHAIPERAVINWHARGERSDSMAIRFLSVSEEENVVVLETLAEIAHPGSPGDQKTVVPLDYVRAVWKDQDGWHAAIVDVLA